MNRLICIISCFLVMVSCERREKNTVKRVTPILTSNSPVHFGKELRVSTLNYTEQHYYEMLLPSGGTSEVASFTMTEARFSREGLYVVSSFDEEGFIGSDSVIVDIIPAAVPCNPSVNKLTSPTIGVSMDFTFVGSRSEGGDQRRVYANSSSGDFDLVFGHPNDPDKESTYISKQQSSFNTADEVSVSMNLGGTLYWGTPEQFVHVKVESGKTYFILCDFEMISGSTKFLINTRLELD